MIVTIDNIQKSVVRNCGMWVLSFYHICRTRPHIIIVGTEVIGCSIAYHLRQAGVQVITIGPEEFAVGHSVPLLTSL
jgi:NADPH-dependent 2,4-dienoyl-CoA reductase/sulfur reductase-like enzyme